MARQLEALKYQKAEERATRSTSSPSLAEWSNTSPGESADSNGRLLFDDSQLPFKDFMLGTFILDRDSVIDTYKL